MSAEATTQSTATATSPPSVVRELTEKRTETATHWLLSDGSIRAEISEAPTRYRDEGGEWTDIDTSLVPALDPGAVESAATSLIATFDAQEPAESPVTLEGDGYKVGIDMLGVAEAARITLGDTTRYLNVATDTDLEYQALGAGIKETVVLRSADAPSTFDFALDLDGLKVRRDPFGGHALYREGEDEPVLALGALVVFDSGADAAGEPAYCEGAEMTVTERGDGSVLVHYDVPRAWLDDPSRVFPVMVDPTLTSLDAYMDTFVCSANPTSSYFTNAGMGVGYSASLGTVRSFAKFNLTSVPATAYVTSATAQFYQYSRTGTSSTARWGEVSEAWNSSTNWNTQPAYTYGGDFTADSGNGWKTFRLDDVAQGWVGDNSSNYGLSLYYVDASTYWTYYTQDYSDQTKRPKITVTYSGTP